MQFRNFQFQDLKIVFLLLKFSNFEIRNYYMGF